MDDIESLDDDILELDNSPISSPTREKEDAVPPIQEPPINLLSMITVEDVLAEMTPDHLCYQRREFERTYQEYMNLAWIWHNFARAILAINNIVSPSWRMIIYFYTLSQSIEPTR